MQCDFKTNLKFNLKFDGTQGITFIHERIEAPKISYHIILYHKFVIVTKALVYGVDI